MRFWNFIKKLFGRKYISYKHNPIEQLRQNGVKPVFAYSHSSKSKEVKTNGINN